jgi:hypothetical protein
MNELGGECAINGNLSSDLRLYPSNQILGFHSTSRKRRLRTNPANPVSDRAGRLDMGVADWRTDTLDGRVVPPQPGHRLSLPHLERVAPCMPL